MLNYYYYYCFFLVLLLSEPFLETKTELSSASYRLSRERKKRKGEHAQPDALKTERKERRYPPFSLLVIGMERKKKILFCTRDFGYVDVSA